MVKFIAFAVFVAVVGFFVSQTTAFGQATSPTPTTTTTTPTPTTAVPSGAPATGFGPN